MRTIYLPALDRRVTLGAYLQAIRLAKAHPTTTFRQGLTTWWPTTGAEIVQQFRRGLMERINAQIPMSSAGGPPHAP